ncbi:hypothetical protein JK358_09560 [Nocardia sp. 2]|uniref:VWA domain-containing protein n=1 Tax=Nocardia acididurans TaxID=2802282 RepID=A0ABS1M1V8_9NOCA|nr:hypothetical protein [Nocardia acididurans]MBL1074643.1 hypothetical protein [Nocardia acididurans]
MNTAEILRHFRTHGAPLTLSRAGAVAWDDAEFHHAAYISDPQEYALLALVPGVRDAQRARVLLQTLSVSRTELPAETRAILDKATRALLFGIAPNTVVTVLLALRRLRANHKHTTRAVLTFVLDHPDAELLIAARRPSLRDAFEHALGKATARGLARRIAEGDTDSPELRRKLLRYTTNPATAPARVAQLYAPGTHGIPTLADPVAPLEPPRTREPIVSVTNRGDIAATLVHVYRGGPVAELRSALAGYVAAATRDLPRVSARVALVLDTSESMRGYGDREWALLSQAEALRLVLGEICDHLTVIEAGAAQTAPTDLATGVLNALDTGPRSATGDPGAQTARDDFGDREGVAAGVVPTATPGRAVGPAAPGGAVGSAAPGGAVGSAAPGGAGGPVAPGGAPDLVVVVTDGYENRLPGDLARVAATLPRIGVETPILLCLATFTASDNRGLRDPAPGLPHQIFWHQDDFGALLPWLFAHTASGRDWIAAAATRFLDRRLEGATS